MNEQIYEQKLDCIERRESCVEQLNNITNSLVDLQLNEHLSDEFRTELSKGKAEQIMRLRALIESYDSMIDGYDTMNENLLKKAEDSRDRVLGYYKRFNIKPSQETTDGFESLINSFK